MSIENEVPLTDFEDEDEPEKTPGQGYDDGEYWDNRYGTWAQDPYDWLVEYQDIEPYLQHFFDKVSPILCPGCGNAPLHPQMYEAGYSKQICVDTSVVVIDQSIERYAKSHPDMVFEVGDCTLMDKYVDGSFQYILDKSLIDTLRCEAGSYDICEKFVNEMYRLLPDGGIFFTISLNTYTVQDIAQYYERSHWKWSVAAAEICNPQYEKAKDNTPFYTLIVCSKNSDPTLQDTLNDLVSKGNARYAFGEDGKRILIR